jgi:hypothetical protein
VQHRASELMKHSTKIYHVSTPFLERIIKRKGQDKERERKLDIAGQYRFIGSCPFSFYCYLMIVGLRVGMGLPVWADGGL